MPEERWNLAAIAEVIGGSLEGDANLFIDRAASLEAAGKNDISFIEKPELAEAAKKSKAGCLIVPENFSGILPCPAIKVKSPKLAFARIAAKLHPSRSRHAKIHPSALIAADAKLGKGLFIGAFICIGEKSEIGEGTQIRAGAKIGDGVRIGRDCIIHPNVFIEDGAEIGNRVILHAGVVVGADGFGYVKDGPKNVKFPQIGGVVVEDDVEIGANSCIDRGSLGETRIGKGTKIDNLVQIAHNVVVGKNCLIAALSGISGSSTLGDEVILAGQVGIADHVRIESGAIIGAKSAVFPNKIIRKGFWMGIPARKIEDYKKQQAILRQIERSKRT